MENKKNARPISFMPGPVRNFIKATYLSWVRCRNKSKFVQLGKLSYLGRHFRLDRNAPFRVRIGDRTNVEEYNIRNVQGGDINVGSDCWFGVYDIIMGPLEFGDASRTGPHVKILGARHALLSSEGSQNSPTVIGKNVWISTDVIIYYGVKIGDNAVIAPGSVVNKDVLANTYVAGNPARDLTKLSGLEAQMKQRGQPSPASEPTPAAPAPGQGT